MIRQPMMLKMAVLCAALTTALAQAQESTTPPPTTAADPPAQATTLDVLMVTATKRSESLQNVAVAVSALGYDDIEQRGLTGMADYLTKLPSVTMQDRGPGRNQVVIRGIASEASGTADNTVGIYIGEMPLSAGLAFGANGYPDLKLYDVNRVEVLRGPQGTLYGSGSMGGTIKVVPNDPVTGVYEATANIGYSRTAHGGGNHDLGAAFNLPFGEHAALRMSAYRYQQSGFIDNQHPGITFREPLEALGGAALADLGVPDPGIAPRSDTDVNQTTTQGARIAGTIELGERVVATASYLHQKSVADGLPEVDAIAGHPYTQQRFTEERLEDRFDMANLVVTYAGDRFDFTSSTGYMSRDLMQSRELSKAFVSAPLLLVDPNTTRNLAQELRISSNDDGRVQWLAGAFYQKLKGTGRQNLRWLGNEPALTAFMDTVIFGAPVGLTLDSPLYVRDDRSTEQQTAAFGQISFNLTDTLLAKVGGRWFQYDQAVDGFEDGAFAGGTPVGGEPTVSHPKNKEDGFNPMAGLEFRPHEDRLYYLQASKGFRLGGPQPGVPVNAPGCGAELEALGITHEQTRRGLRSDQLWSYEAGGKLRLGDGRVTLNGAAYYVDWKDIPVAYGMTCGFSFGANAGSASSRGVEVELAAALTGQLTLNVSGSYVDTQLEEDMPAATGIAGNRGDRLPGVPRTNFQLGLQYDFALGNRNAFLRTDYAYVGQFHNRFPGDVGYAPAGDYGLLDLRGGVMLSDRLWLEVYVSNVTDEMPVLLVDIEFGDGRYYIGRPRMMGAVLRFRY